MLKVGITGGIGSGKSLVAHIFQVLGVPVYFADAEAKNLMNNDAGLRAKIQEAFGDEAYNEQGLNRVWLAVKAFDNSANTALLNSIVHPAVFEHAESWMQYQAQKQMPYALKEAALFFESGSAGNMDLMIGVSAPKSLRLMRAMQRDGLSREAVLARMSKQIDESLKMKLCDFVIVNDDQQMVIPQVLKLHETLLEKTVNQANCL